MSVEVWWMVLPVEGSSTSRSNTGLGTNLFTTNPTLIWSQAPTVKAGDCTVVQFVPAKDREDMKHISMALQIVSECNVSLHWPDCQRCPLNMWHDNMTQCTLVESSNIAYMFRVKNGGSNSSWTSELLWTSQTAADSNPHHNTMTVCTNFHTNWGSSLFPFQKDTFGLLVDWLNTNKQKGLWGFSNNDICAVLGYYAVYSGNPLTFRENLSIKIPKHNRLYIVLVSLTNIKKNALMNHFRCSVPAC
jgi:hypothetical protein